MKRPLYSNDEKKSTKISKTNNYVSLQVMEHNKGHDTWRWTLGYWHGTGTKMWWG